MESGNSTPLKYLLLLCLLCAIIFTQFERFVKEPYMDEIFHIPQAQDYCRFAFSKWNDKITTFPGLYLLSVGYYLIPKLFGFECSVSFLRSINIIFALFQFLIFERILQKVNPNDKLENSFKAFALTLFPVLFFFNFLYYTDSGSILFTFWMYYLALQKQYFKSSFVFYLILICICFKKQTNVIWIVFVVFNEILHQYELETSPQEDFLLYTWRFIEYTFRNLVKLILQFWSFVILVLAFIGFVIINKGIVVGDRSAHEAVFNFGQFCYFLAFSFFFLFMDFTTFNLPLIRNFFQSIRKAMLRDYIILISLIALSLILVHFYSPAHLYLLSDNRHFTFYIWKRVYERFVWAKYVLVPFYFVCFWTFWTNLRQSKSSLWCLAFFVCTGFVLIPALLMEFRYYLIPYLWISLHTHSPAGKIGTFVQLLFFSIINIGVFYLFLLKPFTWVNGETARFMW